MRTALVLVLLLALAGCGGTSRRSAPPPRRTITTAPARPRRIHAPHDAAVPILVYHVIAVAAPDERYPGLFVPPAEFRAQLHWLAAHGWHPVTIDAILRYWRDGVPLPSKPVALTFDDGYPEDVTTVRPLLVAHDWPGNLNLQIGNLVPAHVRMLLRAGWEVDVHTFTHPDLTTVGPAQLVREIAHARSWIRGVFGVPAEVFCYPLGRYDRAVVAQVRRAGFLAAETENPGWASPREGLLTLDRIRISPGDGVAGLAAKLRPG